MHEIQQKLLALIQELDLGQHTLRQIGEMIGESSPQKIKHHLEQLEKRGLIRLDRAKGVIEKARAGSASGLLTNARLLSIPILGSANAGPATLLADQNIEGYLKVSSTFVGGHLNHDLFALKVDGPSMNRAQIDGKRLEDGDFVIVDANAREPRDGQIVLSVIDGMANIKRFRLDVENRQVVLLSDSTQNFSPIFIHEDDDFLINGTVIQVVKRPK